MTANQYLATTKDNFYPYNFKKTIEMFDNNYSRKEISIQLNISYSSVTYYIKNRYKIEQRVQKQEEVREKLCRLYLEGLSLEEIGKKYGITRQAVSLKFSSHLIDIEELKEQRDFENKEIKIYNLYKLGYTTNEIATMLNYKTNRKVYRIREQLIKKGYPLFLVEVTSTQRNERNNESKMIEIYQSFKKGISVQNIAEHYNISVPTVYRYVHKIEKKIQETPTQL